MNADHIMMKSRWFRASAIESTVGALAVAFHIIDRKLAMMACALVREDQHLGFVRLLDEVRQIR